MDAATLTDRYVAAAMRTVPESSRPDLQNELRGSIEDAIEARSASGEPRDVAEHAVLTELGDPERLAAGYTDRKLYLIGPEHYLEWWRLLKILLAIVPACAVFGVALGTTIAGQSIGEIIGTTWAVLLSVIVHIGFWTTMVFFIIERSGKTDAALTGPWSPDELPELRAPAVGFGDMVASLVFLAIGAGAILWDQLVGFVRLGGEPLPVLDPGLWPWWIAGLLALMAMEAVFAIVLFQARRWTPVLAVVNAVLALAVAVPAIFLVSRGALLNPAFFTEVIPPDSADEVFAIVSILTGFGFAVIAGWDIVDGMLKTWREVRGTVPAAPSTRSRV